MGAFRPFSRCADTRLSSCRHERGTQTEYVYVNQPTGNPNPHNFIIEEVMAIGKFVIARVRYPDCSNYEGRKVLVFEGTTTRTLQTQVALDPHFCDSKVHPSPVARFEPTNRGWNYAISFCQSA